MKRFSVICVLLIVLALALTACGGSRGGGSGPEAGKELFNQTVIGTNAGCATCHSLEKGVTIVGPSLATIATAAETAEPGKTAEEYLKESIVEPNKVIVEGFTPNVMPQNWASVLSEDQINNLVAYLMTLK